MTLTLMQEQVPTWSDYLQAKKDLFLSWMPLTDNVPRLERMHPPWNDITLLLDTLADDDPNVGGDRDGISLAPLDSFMDPEEEQARRLEAILNEAAARRLEESMPTWKDYLQSKQELFLSWMPSDMIDLADEDPTRQQYSWRLLMMQLLRNTLADDDPKWKQAQMETPMMPKQKDWKLSMMQLLMDTLADDDPWVTTLEPKQISRGEQHMMLRLIQFSLPNTPADVDPPAPSVPDMNKLADDDPF